ncbi:MAG: glycoside hydrolase family 5 protein [Candidatus Marinimicrobia bacterium]|nr:glycoside hydrolase family 5 protein [Candidatus Neomarinimicrobiota bacterium]
MKNRFLILISLLNLFLFNCKEETSKPKVEQIRFENIYDANAALGRAINLGNALEAPNEGEWGVTIQDNYLSMIREKGFTGVRIPIRWSAHTTETAPFTIFPDFLARVDHVVNLALENDLVVVINIHHFEEIFTHPEENKAKLLSIWTQLSEHYKDFPQNLFFEILNEPHNKLTAELWNNYLAECLTLIREHNPDRPVVIGTANWGGISDMNKLVVPEGEENLILTIHYYEPFQFTHQGAEWTDGSDEWLGRKWLGTADEQYAVLQHFQQIKSFADARNMPVFLGEFGAYKKADMASRATWTSFIVNSAGQFGFSWAYWEFCSGFGIYNPADGTWNTYLVNALIQE